jgi:actin-related protein
MEEKQAVVIDNGTGMIKAGIGGDEAPKVYFPTVIGKPKYESMMCQDNKDCYIGDDAIAKKGVLKLSYPLNNGIVENMDDMILIWRHCYFEQLKVDPDQHPVLLTEAALNPRENREKMVEIFFEEFKVPGFYVYTQAVLALYSSGRTTGLVCDSGDGVTHIVTVYDGYSIKNAIERMNIAGRNLTNYMQKYLAKEGHSFESTSEKEIAKSIKEKLCYVPLDYEAELKAFAENPDKKKEFELPDGNKIKIGDLVIKTPECLF